MIKPILLATSMLFSVPAFAQEVPAQDNTRPAQAAPAPKQATPPTTDDKAPGVQDQAAAQLQARSGWGQWPACSRAAGLR